MLLCFKVLNLILYNYINETHLDMQVNHISYQITTISSAT
jgi:hypothetical protein